MPIYIWFPSLNGLIAGFVFMSIPPAADQFMELFGAGYGGLAIFLSGLVWAHALGQIPAGIAADRLGVFRLLLAATLVGCAANFLPFLAPASLGFATAARFLLGFCTALQFLTLMRILGILVPPAGMPKAQACYGGAFGIGTVLPYLIVPRFGSLAWMFSYILGGCGYFLVFALAFLLPREKFNLPPSRSDGHPRIAASMAAILGSPAIWALGIVHGLSYGTMNNLGQWLPSFLADLGGGTLGDWAPAAILLLLLSSFGRAASGHVLRLSSRAGIIASGMFLTTILYLALGLAPWVQVALAAGLALAVVCCINYGSIFTLASWALAPAYMATAIGAMTMIANLTSASLTLLLGNVREFSGSFRAGYLASGLAALAVWLSTRGIIRRLDRRVLDKTAEK